MKTKIAAFALAIGVCLFWLATQTGVAFGKAKIQSQFQQTYSLASTGEVRLDNVNGTIRITAWDRPEIKIDAVKAADRQSDLDDVKIEIKAQADRISIHTVYPRHKRTFWGRNNSATVDYDLQVPANARLSKIENVNGSIEIVGVRGLIRASNVNGRVGLEGVAADANLETVNGRLQASFADLETVKHASLKTVNGRVALKLPVGASAELSANTVNGSINSGAGLPIKKHWPIGSDLHTTLGKGGPQIRAETVNGSIQIELTKSTPEQNPAAR